MLKSYLTLWFFKKKMYFQIYGIIFYLFKHAFTRKSSFILMNLIKFLYTLIMKIGFHRR